MKKKKIVLIISLVILEIFTLSLTINSLKNRPVILDDVVLKEFKVDRNTFGIYIENNQGEYVVYNGSTWPTGYLFDDVNSICIDENGEEIENALSYANSTVSVVAGSTSYCYIYFETQKDDITIAVATDNTSGSAGTEAFYTKSLACSTGENVPSDIYYNTKWNGIVVGSVRKRGTSCTLDYTTDSTTHTNELLSAVVENNATDLTNYKCNGKNFFGYRYQGTNPNNYIWFNNEMWRIIGLMDTCKNSSCSNVADREELVKIIRNDSLGYLTYGSSSSNSYKTWGTNSLYTLLNTYYYGDTVLAKTDASSTSYCYAQRLNSSIQSNCDYSVIGMKSDDYYGSMVKEVYWLTGGQLSGNTKIGNLLCTDEASSVALASVGMMSASDYAFASSTANTNSTYEFDLDDSTISLNNWLYSNNYEWTMTPISDISGCVTLIKYGELSFSLTENNSTSFPTDITSGYNVRPAVYLDSSVYVVEGNGTEANPYQIAMSSNS